MPKWIFNHWKLLFLLIAVITFQQNAVSQEQTDFDGDGISDLTYVTSSGANFFWSGEGSGGAGEQLGNIFGLVDARPVIGHWLDVVTPSLGVIQLAKDGKTLVWKILLQNGLLLQQNFGRSGDVYLAGGDFDGNGISDGAVVRHSGKSLEWYVRLNMFSGFSESKEKRFKFGVNGDRVLFLNLGGKQDWAAVFGRAKDGKAQLLLRNVLTGRTVARKEFKRAFALGDRPRPFPIRSGDGTDVLGIVRSDGYDTTLYVYDLNGKIIANPTFVGQGTITVGKFSSESDGEAIAFQKETEVLIFDPFTSTFETKAASTGILVDEISVDLLVAPTPIQ
jgi:hypothetical protein